MINKFLEKTDFASTPLAVNSFEPAAFLINKGAKKLWENHRKTARFVSALQYLTNPIDRGIQALATPLFATASFIYTTHVDCGNYFQSCESPKLGKAIYVACSAIIFLPTVATKTVLIWIPLAANTAIHLFPFKVISACKDNRPHNFFVRRNYHRIKNKHNPDFLRDACSPLWSDKSSAEQLIRPKLRELIFFETDLLANYENEIETYNVDGASSQFIKEPVIKEPGAGSRPNDKFLKNAHRMEFLDNFRYHFSNTLTPNFTVDTCPFLSHISEHAGTDSAFFLPEGISEAEKIAEVKWRYGFCLNHLRELKAYNLFVGGISNKLHLPYIDPWIERVGVILAYTYQQLTGPPAAKLKSARNVVTEQDD